MSFNTINENKELKLEQDICEIKEVLSYVVEMSANQSAGGGPFYISNRVREILDKWKEEEEE